MFSRKCSLAALSSLFCLGFFGALSNAAHARPLFESHAFPTAVTKAFSKAKIDLSDVSAYARPIPPFVSRRPHSYQLGHMGLANPASVTKVFTTGLALEKLGPTYRFKTDFEALSEPVDGVLQGDLYIKGGGSPVFKTTDLWAALRALREDGLKVINGSVILDRTAFRPVGEDEAIGDGDDFDDDAPYRAYHAQPDALLINYGAMMLNFIPDQGGVKVKGLEAPANWAFISDLNAVGGRCVAWKNKLSVDFKRIGKDVAVTLHGNYPVRCGESQMPIQIPKVDWLWESWFRELWAELGGQFNGRVLEGKTPDEAISLHSVYSSPLSDVIKLMNKYSSNVMARHLELSVAGPDGNFDQLMKSWLSEVGIDASHWHFSNGSGLTRDNRIDAKGLTDYFAYMATRSDFPDFLASLPHAGTDGTLYRHVKNIDGYGYLKTGSLSGVRTIGGYVRDKGGQWWAVGVIVHSPRAYAAWRPMETLLQSIYDKH